MVFAGTNTKYSNKELVEVFDTPSAPSASANYYYGNHNPNIANSTYDVYSKTNNSKYGSSYYSNTPLQSAPTIGAPYGTPYGTDGNGALDVQKAMKTVTIKCEHCGQIYEYRMKRQCPNCGGIPVKQKPI
jgi:ribosomal protein L37E